MAHVNPLTKREKDVVKLVLQGMSNKLIASSLGISKRTVEFHLKNIYAKYQVSSRIKLILKLVHTTGAAELEALGYSTVESPGENAENRDRRDARPDAFPGLAHCSPARQGASNPPQVASATNDSGRPGVRAPEAA